MSETDENLDQLSRPMLERYVEMRRRIDAEARTIESLAHVLTRFKHCHNDSVEIDPFALACIHEVIERSVWVCWRRWTPSSVLVRHSSA